MSLNSNNLTFVIVTYKSEGVIIDCIKSLPKDSNIIIIENSNNPKLKQDLEGKFLNLTVFLEKNIGMGPANNKGIKICKTDFAFVINPDVRFENDSIKKLIEFSKHKNDYAILAPISNQIEYPNYIIKNKSIVNDKLDYLDVDTVDGFAMLINKKKLDENMDVKNQNYFDENFFMYLENDDLCKRIKDISEKIFVVPSAKISHLGAKAVNPKYKNEIELSRNWHWMWSKFYFNKKHFGYSRAFIDGFPKYTSNIIKYLIYFLMNNKRKKEKYFNRASGFFNAAIGRTSWYRPNINI